MDLYIFHERTLVGCLMDCTVVPDPRPEASESGFARGTWLGFTETPHAEPDRLAADDFVLGNNDNGDLYRKCRIYPSQTVGDTVAFWFPYKTGR